MEDPFDRSVRDRLEKASLDPSPDVWDRINTKMAPPRNGYPVWVRLAAGLLVAGIAAGYFLQQKQSPQEVAAVIMSAPEPMNDPANEMVQEKVQPARAIPRDIRVSAGSDQQETATLDMVEVDEAGSVSQGIMAMESGPNEPAPTTEQVETTDHEGFQTLVYELPVEIAQEPVAVYATTDRKIDRFTRLIRGVKNGEVSLGQVREFKDGLFTRSFWKEKLSKNTNQIMQ